MDKLTKSIMNSYLKSNKSSRHSKIEADLLRKASNKSRIDLMREMIRYRNDIAWFQMCLMEYQIKSHSNRQAKMANAILSMRVNSTLNTILRNLVRLPSRKGGDEHGQK